MSLRRKLYYNVSLVDIGDISGISVNGAPAEASPVAIRFVTSSGSYGQNADLDRYGNLMEPNQYAGAISSGRKTVQAIGAWFVASTPAAPFFVAPTIIVDFIPETGAVAVVPPIDPAAVRRPRVRLQAGLTGLGSGTLYVQRQHSIEV